MDKTLRDFIVARKAEIKLQLRALKQEWRELQAAESAISDSDSSHGNRTGDSTIKDMIIAVLAEPGTCAEARQIMDMIREKYGKEVQRTSISPQLSRLRKEGRLYMKNNLWCLADEATTPNDETSSVAALDVSENVDPSS